MLLGQIKALLKVQRDIAQQKDGDGNMRDQLASYAKLIAKTSDPISRLCVPIIIFSLCYAFYEAVQLFLFTILIMSVFDRPDAPEIIVGRFIFHAPYRMMGQTRIYP